MSFGSLLKGGLGDIIGAGASLIGGLVQTDAAGDAAKAASKASKNALTLQREQFNTLREDAAPVRTARNVALAQLMAELGLPTEDVELSAPQFETRTINAPDQVIPNAGGRGNPLTIPGQTTTEQFETAPGQYYTPTVSNALAPGEQFAIDEGIKAAQIASGGRLSGNALRALTERSQNIASLSRDNRLNRLMDIVNGTSATAGNNTQQQLQSGAMMSNSLQNIGAARQSGFINQSNALTGTVQNLNNAFQNYAGRNQQAQNNQVNQLLPQLPSPF